MIFIIFLSPRFPPPADRPAWSGILPEFRIVAADLVLGVLFLPAWPSPQAELFGFFYRKIQLHRQLSNLGGLLVFPPTDHRFL